MTGFLVYRNRTLMRWRFMPVSFFENDNSDLLTGARSNPAGLRHCHPAGISCRASVVTALTDTRGRKSVAYPNSAAFPSPSRAADSGASVPPVADAPHPFTLPVIAAATDSRGETAGGVARSPAKHRALTTFSDRLNRFLPLVSLDVSHEESWPGSVHRAHSPALSHNTQGACVS